MHTEAGITWLQTPAKEGLECQELEDTRREAPHTPNPGKSPAQLPYIHFSLLLSKVRSWLGQGCLGVATQEGILKVLTNGKV